MTNRFFVAMIICSFKRNIRKGCEEEEYASYALTERDARKAERRLRMQDAEGSFRAGQLNTRPEEI